MLRLLVDGSQESFVIGIQGETLNTLSHLVIQNGNFNPGGGISSSVEFLFLENVHVTNNSAGLSGGIYSYGALYINDSIIESNSAEFSGGGIDIYAEFGKIFSQSYITNNTAEIYAGIRFLSSNENGGLTIFSPTVIANNKALGIGVPNSSGLNIYDKKMCGQGYCFGTNNEPVTVADNTAADNDGVGNGGGLYPSTSWVDIINASFKGNQASIGGAITFQLNSVIIKK